MKFVRQFLLLLLCVPLTLWAHQNEETKSVEQKSRLGILEGIWNIRAFAVSKEALQTEITPQAISFHEPLMYFGNATFTWETNSSDSKKILSSTFQLDHTKESTSLSSVDMCHEKLTGTYAIQLEGDVATLQPSTSSQRIRVKYHTPSDGFLLPHFEVLFHTEAIPSNSSKKEDTQSIASFPFLGHATTGPASPATFHVTTSSSWHMYISSPESSTKCKGVLFLGERAVNVRLHDVEIQWWQRTPFLMVIMVLMTVLRGFLAYRRETERLTHSSSSVIGKGLKVLPKSISQSKKKK